VIIRIATEGQYELSDDAVADLNELDNAAVASCEASDEAGFKDVFGRLLAFVREKGTPVPDDALAASDLILPPPDVTLAEARQEFTGEGLIPG
jgi:PspA-Associated protein